jgi:fused signal recognition particle receptor
MFNFLKEKLKSALAKFSKSVDEEAQEVVEEAPKKEKKAERKEEKKQQRKEAPKPKPEKRPEPEKKPEPKKEKPAEEKEEPEYVEETKPEPQPLEEEAPPAPPEEEEEPSIELVGIKDTLEEYSEKDIDRIIEILKDIPAFKLDGADKEAKIKVILSMPLARIQDAMDEFDNPSPPKVAEKEEEEEKEEEKEEEAESEKEEEILEEVEKEEEELEERPKKKGFFKRLFGFGKKEETEEPEKEEGEEEKEKRTAEEKEEEALPAPPEEEEEKEEAEEKKEEETEAEEEEPKTLAKLDEKKKKVEEEIEEEDREIEEAEEGEEEGKGFFAKLKQGFTLKTLSESKFEEIFFDLEMALLENNVAVEVIEKIKQDLKERLVEKKLKRSEIDETILDSLKKSLNQILSAEQVDVLRLVKDKRKNNKPFVIVFVGINGSGKTTTIAKMAKHFMNNNMKTVMVAADTFRAAAIQQLEEHANNLGVKLIKQDYGSDPAAVAFDGIRYAEAKGIDVVLVDTAGRMHSNVNLMDEMKKIIRVANPDMKIFIGESITGNDCIEQAKKFNEAIGIDGIVLSKADVDEKGGAAISVSYVTGKPILFIGTGQTYDSLQKFEKGIVMSNLGLE